MKTEVYSWRLSPDLKTGLEREARRLNLSVSAVLELASMDWLKKIAAANDGNDEQQRLQETASKCLGTIGSGDPLRSEKVRLTVRERLARRHAR
jgi:hypothetical protein